jgi:hypothetical protein
VMVVAVVRTIWESISLCTNFVYSASML